MDLSSYKEYKMKTVETKNAPAAIGPYSQAKIFGDFVFCSGQIPIDPTTSQIAGANVREQTEQVCKNIIAILSAAGTTIDKVIKTTCFLTNIDNFGAFNEVYAQYFTGKPARSCVAVRDIPKNALVEIEVIAKI